MRRLSQSLTTIKPQYSAIVIGSGYGGGVAASRLARAGQSVCLLERGKEFLPGEFPDKLSEAMPEFQVDLAAKHIGSSTGLYDLRINDDMNVFVGCGLGGTSLVNANVSLKAEPWVFEDSCWPAVIRSEADDQQSPLNEGYRRAFAMLKPTTYPADYPQLAKLSAHGKAADALGKSFELTPINVTFNDGTNHVGVEQSACNNCGDCVTGCNIGAKNTTAMNYLADACNHHAEIFCEAKVSHIERCGDLWRVYYSPQSLQRDVFDDAPLFVLAENVVLAAGTLGSTEILLRSKDKGLPLSKQVGQRFTGNGDVLAFGYNCDQSINGIGFGERAASSLEPVGPCITSVIDCRDDTNRDQQLVIEEGSLPGLMAPLLGSAFSAISGVSGVDTDSGFIDRLRERWRAAESVWRGAYHGAVNHTQTYLVMSHDDGAGEMNLENDRLRVHWQGVGEQTIFQHIDQTLQSVTATLGGSYIANPMWSELMGHDLITVHPLGGCVMASSAEQGVVNDRCQVFSSQQGDAVYSNLFVCDGAVMPRSLGVNPLLTITALAERSCQLMAADKGWDEHYSETSTPDSAAPTEQLGIQFTESMKGHVSLNTDLDYDAAEQQGRVDDQSFEFILTVSSDDLDNMLSDEHHRASLMGSVKAPALSAEPLMAVGGEFQLFYRDPDQVGRRLMVYKMQLVDSTGRRYFFHGFKSVADNKGLDVWSDTTTLFITLYDGENEQAPLLARGKLFIEPADFAKQMTTMKARHADNAAEAIQAVARFGRFFAGAVAETYGGPLAPFRVVDANAPGRERRSLRTDPAKRYPLTTDDGVDLLLTRYQGGDKGPVMLVHGLGVSSKIFSLDTIKTNLVEYLYAGGYDVWLLDYRASIDLPASQQLFDGDAIAQFDYPAAVAKIRAVTESDSIQVVAHCFGGCTFSMSLLSGLQGVRSVVFSQVSTHFEGALLPKLKAGLYLPKVLSKIGVESLTAYRDSHANWFEKLYDHALRLYPQEYEEWSNNPIDKRIAFMYGQLWELDQLNRDTHDTLHELFGVANIKAFEHLGALMRAGHAVNAKGENKYLSGAANMAMPIRFIHGEENQTFLPKGSEEAMAYLSAANGGEFYDLEMIEGYGHIDCMFGKNAADDVYPLIKEHLDKNL